MNKPQKFTKNASINIDRYYIYIITNIINKKIYIGKRKCPKGKTPIEDSYMGSGVVLRDAIIKYGIGNFKKSISSDHIKTNAEANEKERLLINRLDSTNRKVGYNRTAGGDGGYLTEFYTEEQKAVYRSKFVGRKLSDEHKKKLSDANRGHVVVLSDDTRRQINEKNRHPTNETRKKLSEAGKKAWATGSRKRKKIKCITDNIIFDNIREAVIYMGGDYDNNFNIALGIYKVCLGYRKTYQGKLWEYCNA
jgi:group I intron endonuclease